MLGVLVVGLLIGSAVADNVASTCDHGVFPDVLIQAEGQEPCVKTPCVVNPGKDVHLQLNFTSPRYLEHIAPDVVAHVLGLDVPFPLNQRDACQGIVNTPCPLVAGEKVTYEFSISLMSMLPSIQLQLKFSIKDKDANDEPVVCFNVPLQVKN